MDAQSAQSNQRLGTAAGLYGGRTLPTILEMEASFMHVKNLESPREEATMRDIRQDIVGKTTAAAQN